MGLSRHPAFIPKISQDMSTANRLESDANEIFSAALRAVQADRLIGDSDWMSWSPRGLPDYDRIVVVGMGKASMALAGEVERALGDRINHGFVVVPHGHPQTYPFRLHRPRAIEVIEAGHPIPDEGSMRAARRMLEEAERCGSADLLLVLISGGGSALCADFGGDITLDDAGETFDLLLASGADIHDINTVRKQISRIGGGRLAAAAGETDVLALVVSDVVGDDLSIIASGPTVPNDSSSEDALHVLERFDLVRRIPERVRRLIEDGGLGRAEERDFAQVETRLLGSNRQALEAAAGRAAEMGYDVEVVTRELTGEAREAGTEMASHAAEAAPGRCHLWGGETTVTVRGDGKGGRSQELALAAAIGLAGLDRTATVLSAGTDGRDGPTDAAGAVATNETVAAARESGLDPLEFLERNDSYHFWDQLGGHIVTGPTHTNVMDIQVLLTD